MGYTLQIFITKKKLRKNLEKKFSHHWPEPSSWLSFSPYQSNHHQALSCQKYHHPLQRSSCCYTCLQPRVSDECDVMLDAQMDEEAHGTQMVNQARHFLMWWLGFFPGVRISDYGTEIGSYMLNRWTELKWIVLNLNQIELKGIFIHLFWQLFF